MSDYFKHFPITTFMNTYAKYRSIFIKIDGAFYIQLSNLNILKKYFYIIKITSFLKKKTSIKNCVQNYKSNTALLTWKPIKTTFDQFFKSGF